MKYKKTTEEKETEKWTKIVFYTYTCCTIGKFGSKEYYLTWERSLGWFSIRPTLFDELCDWWTDHAYCKKIRRMRKGEILKKPRCTWPYRCFFVELVLFSLSPSSSFRLSLSFVQSHSSPSKRYWYKQSLRWGEKRYNFKLARDTSKYDPSLLKIK